MLQGAHLVGGQLQGANLSQAQLQGADFVGAQLQGANLDYAQLQGAVFDLFDAQGALINAAHLEGASLRGTYVWRTDPPLSATGAFVAAPEPGPKYTLGLDCPIGKGLCDWSERSYEALKSLIEIRFQRWAAAIKRYGRSRH